MRTAVTALPELAADVREQYGDTDEYAG